MEDHEFLDTYSYLMRIRENFEHIKNKKYDLEDFTNFNSAIKNIYKDKKEKFKNKKAKPKEEPKEEPKVEPKEEFKAESKAESKEEPKEEFKAESNDHTSYLKEKIRFKSNMYWLYILFFILIGLLLLSLILRLFFFRPSSNNIQQIPMNYEANASSNDASSNDASSNDASSNGLFNTSSSNNASSNGLFNNASSNTSYIQPFSSNDVIKPKPFSIIEWFKSLFIKNSEIPPTTTTGGGIKRKYRKKL